MSEYITLLGTEQVQKAASQMSQAAETIQRSVGYFDELLEHKLRRAEELVNRLEVLASKEGEIIDDQMP